MDRVKALFGDEPNQIPFVEMARFEIRRDKHDQSGILAGHDFGGENEEFENWMMDQFSRCLAPDRPKCDPKDVAMMLEGLSWSVSGKTKIRAVGLAIVYFSPDEVKEISLELGKFAKPHWVVMCRDANKCMQAVFDALLCLQ